MKEPSELSKALEVILKSTAIEPSSNQGRNGYSTPPIVAYGEEASPEGEMHLRDYWRTIRKRLWLIIGLALIVGMIVALRQARQPDIYQAAVPPFFHKPCPNCPLRIDPSFLLREVSR